MRARDFALGAFIGGVATGVAVALTTPKNGAELRTDIKKEAETLYEEGRNKFDATYEAASEKANETRANLDDTFATINTRVNELKDEAKAAVEEFKAKAEKATPETVEEFETNIEAVKEEVVAELEELNEALNAAE